MNLDLYDKSYDYLCEKLGHNSKILDIGCGPGNISKYLLQKRPDFSILGIDISPNMIAIAQKNNPTAVFDVLDIRQIHTLNITFDAIICGFGLPYLSDNDIEKQTSDIYCLLNNDGFIYYSFVEGKASQSGLKKGSSGYSMYFHYHEVENIKEKLLENNFSNIKSFDYKYFIDKKTFETHNVLIGVKI